MGQTQTFPRRTRTLLQTLCLLVFLPALASAQLQVSILPTNVSCNGLCDGAAAAAASGGSGNYTFEWSNSAGTAAVTGLCAGVYTVTVTDGALSGTASVAITQPPPLSLTIHVENQICSLAPDGIMIANPAGGTPPYTYLWSNTSTNDTITGLAEGIYSVTVTDARNCIVTGQDTVYLWNEGLWLIMDTLDIRCFGDSNGMLHVGVMSGTQPYTYSWSNGQVTQDITGLGPGNYTVTVIDVNGCSNTASAYVTEPPPLDANVITTPGNCGKPGSATILPFGGTPPYTVIWSNDSTTTTITAGAGMVMVTLTDANGCEFNAGLTIPGDTVHLQATGQPLVGAGCLVGGSATANASGGSGNYTYQWSNGNLTQIATNLLANTTYTVTVTEQPSGCTATATASVLPLPALTVSAQALSPAGCAVGGSASASAAGGLAPYTFLWDNTTSGAAVNNLPAGQHIVVATDATGCTAADTIQIMQLPPPAVTAQVLLPANCVGGGGSAQASANGGTAPYTWLWNNGETTPVAVNLAAGLATVIVTDSAACKDTATVSVPQVDPPAVSISVSKQITCLAPATVVAVVSGGKAPYTFLWSTNATNDTTTLGTGLHSVTVTDAAGCKAVGLITIAPPPLPVVVIDTFTNATCSAPGTATAVGSSGTPPYTWLWSNGETTPVAVNLAAGTHTVILTDAGGCKDTASVTIGLTNNGGIKVGDYVWLDDDQDGLQDNSEPGVANVKVKLFKPGPDNLFGTSDDILADSTKTNSLGKYQFSCVSPGIFILIFSNVPSGYQFTGKDKGADCVDSDAKSNGHTDPFIITAGQADNLCLDAGIQTICLNVKYPGLICCSQTICEGTAPALLYGTVPPASGSGPLEFQWMQYVKIGAAPPTWVGIPGATGASYQPGPVFKTTQFMRCVRRQGCTSFLESNVVKITVKPPGSPGCGQFFGDFIVTPAGRSAVRVQWTTQPEFTQYRYILERSTDRQNWSPVTEMMGYQDASALNHYETLDPAPVDGMNYYRIRRQSAGGDENVSEMREIELHFAAGESLAVYPNPVSQILHIRNRMAYDSDAQVELFGASGARLETLHIPAGRFEHFEVPVSHLPQGIYWVRVRLGSAAVQTVKVGKF